MAEPEKLNWLSRGWISFKDYLGLFNSQVITKLVKWSFTWLLASLPIIFVAIKQYIYKGTLEWITICSKGEFFLVCIVMVAEPLGDAILAKKKNVTLLIVAVTSIMLIASFTYVFSITNVSENPHLLAPNSAFTGKGDSSSTYLKSDTFSVSLLQQKNNGGKFRNSPQDKEKKEGSNTPEERVEEMSWFFFCLSLIVGLAAVCITNMVKKDGHE